MRIKKNGIKILDGLPDDENKQGCNSANCPPPGKSTPYPHKRAIGDTHGKYRTTWPTVKWVSSLGQ